MRGREGGAGEMATGASTLRQDPGHQHASGACRPGATVVTRRGQAERDRNHDARTGEGDRGRAQGRRALERVRVCRPDCRHRPRPCPAHEGGSRDPVGRAAGRADLGEPRELLNVFQAHEIGCHIITVTNDILKKLSLVGGTGARGLEAFDADDVETASRSFALSRAFTRAGRRVARGPRRPPRCTRHPDPGSATLRRDAASERPAVSPVAVVNLSPSRHAPPTSSPKLNMNIRWDRTRGPATSSSGITPGVTFASRARRDLVGAAREPFRPRPVMCGPRSRRLGPGPRRPPRELPAMTDCHSAELKSSGVGRPAWVHPHLVDTWQTPFS